MLKYDSRLLVREDNPGANPGDLVMFKFVPADLPSGVTLTGKPYDLYELFYNPDGSGALGSFDGAGNSYITTPAG